MEFRFSEEQRMIRDAAAGFLAKECGSAAVRAAMATERGYDETLWRKIREEMCWQNIHIPERYGGLGLGYVELAAILEQAGRYLLCAPFFSTACLGVNALRVAASAEQQAAYLPRIAEGCTASLAYLGPGRGAHLGSGQGGSGGGAHLEPGEGGGNRGANRRYPNWDFAAATGTAEKKGGGYRLNGIWRYVPDGHTADLLIIAARLANRSTRAVINNSEPIGLFIVEADAPGLQRRPLPTLDQTRRQAELELKDVPGARLGPSALLGKVGEDGKDDKDEKDQQVATQDSGEAALSAILDLAAAALAAELSGICRQTLDLAVAYAMERKQFNRPIASYQAVKHKAADMMVKAESARSAAYYAACIAQDYLDGGPRAAELAEAASIAKAWCSDAAFFNAGAAIQLHGGVGFTWEYDAHLYFKRARASAACLGDAAWHRERIAAMLLDAPASEPAPRAAAFDKESAA